MKITIELSEAEVKGIKEYLKDFDNQKITKKEVVQYISGVVDCTLHAEQESVSEYIKKYE